jgi:hypothetical protein
MHFLLFLMSKDIFTTAAFAEGYLMCFLGCTNPPLKYFECSYKFRLGQSKRIVYSPVVTICTTSGHYMFHQFNIQQFCVFPTHYIYVFCVDLRTNRHYFRIQR